MEVTFTYEELAKKLGCTELTIRNWLKRYWCKITPGKRGRNGSDALVTLNVATCKALAMDAIDYAKNGKKPFVNFEGADWNQVWKVEEDFPKIEMIGKDRDHIEYKRFEDNFGQTALKTVYFLGEDNRVYKVVALEKGVYHFRSMSDFQRAEFERTFNRITLFDEVGRFWTPVMIKNSKCKWITEPKRKKK